MEEWPRLTNWQRLAVWFGDIMSVLVALQWSFTRSSPAFVAHATSREGLPSTLRTARFAAVLLAISLMADLTLTICSILAEKHGSERAVAVVAEGVKITELDHEFHFRIDVEFRDAQGRLQQGQLYLEPTLPGWHVPHWLEFNVEKEIARRHLGQRFAMNIRYDPEFPSRVWAKDEPWNRQRTRAFAFLELHVVQLVFVTLFLLPWVVMDIPVGGFAEVLYYLNNTMAVLNLAFYSILLVAFGSTGRSFFCFVYS